MQEAFLTTSVQAAIAALSQYSGLACFGLGVLASLVVYLLVRPSQIRRDQRALKGLKSQFVALCSHYLLTPITVVQVAVGTLQEEGGVVSSDQRLRLYDAIQRGQQRLWILAEQFLTVMQMESGEFRLNAGVASLSEVVVDAVKAVDPFIREKSLRLSLTDPADQTTAEARFDSRRIKQALVAILDNAIKFTPEGGSVSVEVGEIDGVFRITVRDSGIGMPESVQKHLSEEFYRGTSTYNFDYEGIGLGLFIAQAILREHEGIASFESAPGKGTAVTAQFPRR